MNHDPVVIASPTDPNVEYVPSAYASRRKCDCPSADVWHGDDRITAEGLIRPTKRQVKVLHAEGCTSRVRVPEEPVRKAAAVVGGHSNLSTYLAGLPLPKPCPECGDVRFVGSPVGRKCWACGHEWNPAVLPLKVKSDTSPRRDALAS